MYLSLSIHIYIYIYIYTCYNNVPHVLPPRTRHFASVAAFCRVARIIIVCNCMYIDKLSIYLSIYLSLSLYIYIYIYTHI